MSLSFWKSIFYKVFKLKAGTSSFKRDLWVFSPTVLLQWQEKKKKIKQLWKPRITVNILEKSCSSVQFSCSGMPNSLQPHGLQHASPPCPTPSPRVCLNSCPLSQWCHPAPHPLSSPSPPTFNLSQHQGLFQWVSSSHLVTKVLEFQLQHQSFQWTPRTDFL